LNFFANFVEASKPIEKMLRIWDVQDISERPCMEKEGVLLLETHLKQAGTFLEYGAGGSTMFAAELGVKNIHSVESDKAFLDAVKNKVLSFNPRVFM